MHLGVQELVVILIIVIVLFGGSRLAGIGKALGTSMREFKEEVNRNEGEKRFQRTKNRRNKLL